MNTPNYRSVFTVREWVVLYITSKNPEGVAIDRILPLSSRIIGGPQLSSGTVRGILSGLEAESLVREEGGHFFTTEKGTGVLAELMSSLRLGQSDA